MSTSHGSDPMERRHGEGQGLSRDRTSADRPHTDARVDRHSALAAEKAQYGGIKVGSALYGWLTATGTNVMRVTEPARGGHFAPFEEPELYAEELRAFFRPYREAATR